MIYERKDGKREGEVVVKKNPYPITDECETYRITNKQCLYCNGPIHVIGQDTYWVAECEVCGIGVGGASKDEVVDKIMKTRVPVQTSKPEFEEVEY